MKKHFSTTALSSMCAQLKLAAVAVTCLLIGCLGSAPRVKPPDVDPTQAAQKAIEAYDQDGNGQLSSNEMAACPGIAMAAGSYDRDGDGNISENEIATRIESWYEQQLGLTSLSCTVRYKGKPLEGADIVMEPESYLGEHVKPAYGTTSAGGSGIMAIRDDDLAKQHRGIKAVHYGTYKVRITHPKTTLPAEYNTETTLGHEVAHDLGKPYATFHLK